MARQHKILTPQDQDGQTKINSCNPHPMVSQTKVHPPDTSTMNHSIKWLPVTSLDQPCSYLKPKDQLYIKTSSKRTSSTQSGKEFCKSSWSQEGFRYLGKTDDTFYTCQSQMVVRIKEGTAKH